MDDGRPLPADRGPPADARATARANRGAETAVIVCALTHFRGDPHGAPPPDTWTRSCNNGISAWVLLWRQQLEAKFRHRRLVANASTVFFVGIREEDACGGAEHIHHEHDRDPNYAQQNSHKTPPIVRRTDFGIILLIQSA